MFLKDFIGKTILSGDGQILGYSRCALFSPSFKRITALVCADEEEEDFIFPLSAKKQRGDAFILPRRKTAKVTGMPYSPLLKQVYSAEGEYLGCVRDVVLENLTVVELIAGEKRYPFASVKAFGDCILLHSTNKKTTAKNKKSTHPLFGKLIRFDVWDKNGNLLFKKGKSVTHQTIKTAKKHKKILELTVKTLAY